MITCHKCQYINQPDAKHCINCDVDLLPGETLTDRLVYILGGIFGFLLSIGMLYFLMENPEIAETSQCCLFTNPYIWFIGIFLFPISALVSAVRKTPLHKRYEIRARRHQEKDPEQAIADLTEAISLAPEKQKGALLKQRADIFRTIGKEEDAIKDRLDYMESEGAYEDQAKIAQTFKLDSDQFVSSARNAELKQLVSEGKIKAVGYCTKCQKSIELNENLRCGIHPKKKPITVKYVLPKDLEVTFFEVQTEGAKQFKKTRKIRIVVLVVLAIGITMCCLIPWLMGTLSNLTG